MKNLERVERVNSAYDLEYDYYKKDLPDIEESEESRESFDSYQHVFDSRKEFTILGLNSYMKISKNSLNKIASMIDSLPQEYILFTNHKIVKEDILESEANDSSPIFVSDNENKNKDDEQKEDNNDKNISYNEIYEKCLWLYLSLVLCAIFNIVFFIYILVKTDYGFQPYTIYIIVLFCYLLFTGIFGYIKCRLKNFKGCTLKLVTFSIPLIILFGIILYIVNSFKLKGFVIKVIVDVITIIIGIILIYYLYTLIKSQQRYNQIIDKMGERLLTDDKELPIEQLEPSN